MMNASMDTYFRILATILAFCAGGLALGGAGTTPVFLPGSQEPGSWVQPLAGAGLTVREQTGGYRPVPRVTLIDGGAAGWSLEVVDALGQTHVVQIERPRTHSDREDLAWLAFGLLKPVSLDMGGRGGVLGEALGDPPTPSPRRIEYPAPDPLVETSVTIQRDIEGEEPDQDGPSTYQWDRGTEQRRAPARVGVSIPVGGGVSIRPATTVTSAWTAGLALHVHPRVELETSAQFGTIRRGLGIRWWTADVVQWARAGVIKDHLFLGGGVGASFRMDVDDGGLAALPITGVEVLGRAAVHEFISLEGLFSATVDLMGTPGLIPVDRAVGARVRFVVIQSNHPRH